MPTDLRMAVCRVLRPDSDDWGTGFFVEPRGLLLTCAHVARQALDADGSIAIDVFRPEVNGHAPPPLRLGCRPVAGNGPAARRDVALLSLTGTMPDWLATLPILADELASEGRPFRSYGFPSNHSVYGIAADGVVVGSAWTGGTRAAVLVVRSGELSGGFSGAPLVDSELDCVVGIMTATVNRDARQRLENLSRAVPAHCLPSLVPQVRVTPHPLVAEFARLASRRPPTLLDDLMPEHADACMAQRLHPVYAPDVPLEASDLLDRMAAASTNLLLVTGDAGAGKTMFLRRTLPATLLAAHAGERRFVPLYLRATTFAEAEGATVAARLAAALAADSTFLLRTGSAAAELGRLLDACSYRFAILIDGLDEVTPLRRRMDALELLRELALALRDRGHIVVAGSRPFSELARLYLGDPSALHIALDAVSPSERERYFIAMLGAQAGDASKAFDALSGPSLEGTPLLIAFAVSVYGRTGTLPASPLDLYESYIGLMLVQARAQPGTVAGDGAALQEALALLQILAFASLDGELDVESAVRALHGTAAVALSSSALARRHTARLQLDALTDMQLLLYREGEHLRWRHQSIRDYFAGHQMANAGAGDEAAWNAWVRQWRNADRRSAIGFALLARSKSKPLDMDTLHTFALFDGMPPDGETLDFLCDMQAFGAAMAPDALTELVNTCYSRGREHHESFGTCASLFSPTRHPLAHLTRMALTLPYALELTHRLIVDPTLSVVTRLHLARAIYRK